MEYLVFTSNNALASALAEHLPLTVIRNNNQLEDKPLSTNCLAFIDCTSAGAEAILEKLGTTSAEPPFHAVIFLNNGSTPTFVKPFEGLSETFQAPFRLGELLDAAHRLTQQLENSRKQTLSLARDVTLFVATRDLRHSATGERITLTEKEALLLTTLHAAGQAGLPRDALLEAVWGYQEGVDTHTLETHIYRLRQKLKDMVGAASGIAFKDGTYTLDF